MKALFFIEIPAHYHTEESTYHWYKKELQNTHYGCDLLPEIQKISLLCDVILVLPGFNVMQKNITSKIRNRKKLELAIGYELEEVLSEEIETLFFAYQETKQKDSLDVAIINRAWFEKWLEVFKEQGILLTAAISELMLLDCMAQEYLLIKKADYYLLKTTHSSYSIDEENIGYFLTKITASLPDELTLLTTEPQSLTLPVNVKMQIISHSVLKLLAEHYQLPKSFNLLQGKYKAKLKNDWQKIKLASILFLSLLLLATIFQGYQHWQLSKEEEKLDQQRLKIFQTNFPEIKRIINPLAQMKSQLATLKENQKQQGQFIALLAKVAVALREMINQGSISLLGMEFENNTLIIKLNANSLALIEQIKQNLAMQQLMVEIQSSDKVDNQVNASFKVSGNVE